MMVLFMTYDQKDGVTMGSSLAPVVANLYMEHTEHQAISSVIKKPTRWYRYVDDTFVGWPHGKDELQEFLNTLTTSIRISGLLWRWSKVKPYCSWTFW
jgi:hypothetical protein